jgi:Transposase
VVRYLGLDWAYRRAAWCAVGGGAISGEGVVPADEDGLARLVLAVGAEVRACVEMMSGAVWVRDRLADAGWEVQVAHPRKVRDVAPLACKTDRVDARVLAELCRRDLVPALWIPSIEDRALWERLRRRMHLVRMRAWRRTGSSGCSPSGGFGSRSSGCVSPMRWRCSRPAACRSRGAHRSPRRWP